MTFHHKITRLVVTAVIAYLLAELLLPVEAPLLAPLTALLVVQVSSYQTVKHAFQRVLSVGTGVLVAVAVAGTLHFSWWSLAIAIAVALVLGHALKLNDHILEVPISAMLILQLGTEAAATDRVVETIIGAGVGLLAGLVASPVKIRPAAEAIGELGGSTAALLDDIADGLGTVPDERSAARWMERSTRERHEIRQVEAALDQAEESARLNPRARRAELPGPFMRDALDTLEHAAITTRGLTRCVADRTALHLEDADGLGAGMWDSDVRDRLAATLHATAGSARHYARAVSTTDPAELAAELRALDTAIADGRSARTRLGALLREDPGHWPLHGELLVHLDRLLDGFRDAQRPAIATALEPPAADPHTPVLRLDHAAALTLR
ncbi:hypothetical protein GCM10027589_56930 [Actinocorallia lasiicapitis]